MEGLCDWGGSVMGYCVIVGYVIVELDDGETV